MKEYSFAFSIKHPAAKWCPPTSVIDFGCLILKVVRVFSKTSFRFLPSCPTTLAETFILSSLYAMPINIVPLV